MSVPKSPMEEVHGTVYPYVNVKKNLFNPIIDDIKRGIAPINPFA